LVRQQMLLQSSLTVRPSPLSPASSGQQHSSRLLRLLMLCLGSVVFERLQTL
jgi:hypothetical protein